MRPLALLLFVLLVLPATAQPTPGDCAPGTARATLNANDVRATVFNTGSLFNDGEEAGRYVVPAESEASAIYAAGLWIGGKVNDELRIAAVSYGRFEFWPGPLGGDARPVDPSDCSAYDRIWTVSRRDVARYLTTGEATADLLDWPVELGAPVLDGDGIDGNYDLEGGDQPAIRGDQTAWWVMNDVGNVHEWSRTPLLGVEVRVEAFAAAEEAPASGLPTLGQTTFYRYAFTNRSADVIDDAYVSLFGDFSLGNRFDNYFGSDTLRSLYYVYNGDNLDETTTQFDERYEGYGSAPPALGVSVLGGPVGLPNGRDDDFDGSVDEEGERLGLTAFTHFFRDGTPDDCGFPCIGFEHYNAMRGLFWTGFPMKACGFGFNCQGPETTFSFHGDPVTGTGWNEVTAGNAPWLRYGVGSVGPFRLDPRETEVITFAVLFGQGPDHLRSVSVLRAVADEVRIRFERGDLEPRPVTADELAVPTPPEPGPPPALRLLRPSPNPFRGRLALRYEVPAATPLRLAVYDALGRQVAVLFDGTAEAGEHEAALGGAALAPGVYFVRLSVPGGSRTLAITRAAR